MPTTKTTITGPAVTFDPGALRTWLDVTWLDELGVDEEYGRGNGRDILSTLNELIETLREDREQNVWTVADGVERVDIRRTWDGGGCDGALVLVDLDSGLRLCSLHQDHRDFASTEDEGVDCLVAMLTTVAQQANLVATSYREVTGDGVEVVHQVVQISLVDHDVETHLRALEDEMALEPGALKSAVFTVPDVIGSQVGGVKLHRQIIGPYGKVHQVDLDVATAYCRRVGIPYVENRETTFESLAVHTV